MARYDGKLYGPPAERQDDTVANPPDPFADVEQGQRSAAVAPSTWDADAHTVEVIAATENPVGRRDASGPYAEVLDMATLDLSRAVDLPVYDSHRGGSTRATVGIVQSLRVEGNKLRAVLRLSTALDALPVVHRVAEGIVTGVSVAYSVTGWSTSTAPDGTRVKRPTRWTVREISLTPDPADKAARVRSTKAPAEPARAGGIPNNRAANGDKMETEETLDRAEIERRSDIRGLCRAAGLPDENMDQLIDAGATVEQAKAACFDHVQTRTAPVIRTHKPGNDDPAVIVRRQADAVAVRMAGGDCPEDARQYLGDSMLDMARGSLARSGVSTRGMSPDEVFQRSAHGTSDFPLVVSNAMGKVAAEAYKAAESPIKTLCRQRVLRDFKPSTSIRLGEMGRLEEIAESGEITHTSRAENGESFALKTYARAINVSRNLLVNDDLNLLGDMTAAFGESAAQTEADILVDMLTSNPNLSDGTAVFATSRGNMASSGADPDATTLDAARKAMRDFKGLDGKTLISVTPKYLVVGPELETDAEKLLASIYATTTDDVNAWSGKLSLLVEPRITGDDWWVFADPARIAGMVYGYLASAQGVQIQRAEAWDTLGMKYRAYLDFGAGWTDWRAAYYNAGAT
ncbi:MAG: prohead protease/major capsid protein fusion protein [Marinibacterium sp.]